MIEEDYKDNLRARALKLLDNITLQVEDFINSIELPELIELKSKIIRIQKEVQISEVDTVVSKLTMEKFGLDLGDRNRAMDFIAYKHVTWYILYKFGFSYPTIGKYYGMGHSNVLQGVRTIKNEIEQKNPKIIRLFYYLLNKIQSNYKDHVGNISFNVDPTVDPEPISPIIKHKRRSNSPTD